MQQGAGQSGAVSTSRVVLYSVLAGAVGGALAAVGVQLSGVAAGHAPALAASAPAVSVEDEARQRQRAAVLSRLSDPDSATFRNVRQSKVNALYWCGEVNAKNRMGGMVGFHRYVVELQKSAERAEFDQMIVEPSPDMESGQSVKFGAYWTGYCE